MPVNPARIETALHLEFPFVLSEVEGLSTIGFQSETPPGLSIPAPTVRRCIETGPMPGTGDKSCAYW
ncbi:MAG TPA: hypothetical protein VJ823_03550 [Rhodanobacteraceae bacterium]|nr:hypothetical protein [Rhodanobacteraceae bacterium]